LTSIPFNHDFSQLKQHSEDDRKVVERLGGVLTGWSKRCSSACRRLIWHSSVWASFHHAASGAAIQCIRCAFRHAVRFCMIRPTQAITGHAMQAQPAALAVRGTRSPDAYRRQSHHAEFILDKDRSHHRRLTRLGYAMAEEYLKHGWSVVGPFAAKAEPDCMTRGQTDSRVQSKLSTSISRTRSLHCAPA